MDDISFWVGSGSKKTVLVIDFNDGANPQCYAWGYRFDGTSVTAEKMIADIDSADHALSMVVMSGFVNDITYLSHAGLGGNPDYFSTFSGDGDTSNWVMNMGGSELLTDSMWFGMSYTPWDSSFNPLYKPGLPVAASPVNGFADIRIFNTIIYPNPVRDFFTINNYGNFDRMQIFDVNGKLVCEYGILEANPEYSLNAVPKGFYYALFYNNNAVLHGELIIKE
ncbi:MAG: T9SS type A sorting domain-containing protein [Bacteroidales bacterium]